MKETLVSSSELAQNVYIRNVVHIQKGQTELTPKADTIVEQTKQSVISHQVLE